MRTRQRAALQDKTPGNTPRRRAKASSPTLKEAILGTAARKPLASLVFDDASYTFPTFVAGAEGFLGDPDLTEENLDPSLDILHSPSVRRSVARRTGKLPVQSTPLSALRRRPLATPSQLGSPRLRPKAKHVASPLPPSSPPSPFSMTQEPYDQENEDKENAVAVARGAGPGSDAASDPFGFFAVERKLKAQRATRLKPSTSKGKGKSVFLPSRRMPFGELSGDPSKSAHPLRQALKRSPTPLPSPPINDSHDIDDLYADPEEFSRSLGNQRDLRAAREVSDEDKENAPGRLPRVSLAALAASEEEDDEDEIDKENVNSILSALVHAPPSELPDEADENGAIIVPAIIPPEALLFPVTQSGASSCQDNPLRTPHKHPRGRSPVASSGFSNASADSAVSSPVEEHVRARSRSRSVAVREPSSPSPVKPISAYRARPSIAPRPSMTGEESEHEVAAVAAPEPKAAAAKRERGDVPDTDEGSEDPQAYSRRLEELLPRRNPKRAATASRARGRGRGRGGKGKARARSSSVDQNSSESEEPAPKKARGTGRGRGATRARGRGRGKSTSATRGGAKASSSRRAGKGKKNADDEDATMEASEDERMRQRQARVEYFRKLDEEYSMEKEDVYVI